MSLLTKFTYFFFRELLRPYTISFILLIAAFILLKKGKEKAAGRVLGAGILFLYLLSSGFISKPLILSLETMYPSRPVADFEMANAIVVLGGSVLANLPPRIEVEELLGTRVNWGARLYKAGKAPLIIVSGAGQYTGRNGEIRTQANDMKDLLLSWGIPDSAILEETNARNTEENADFTLNVYPPGMPRKILLVTSAFHMQRSVYWYKRAGFDVIPVSADHRAHEEPLRYDDFLPRVLHLQDSSISLKEYFGLWVARAKNIFS